jgi:flavoprotein hydroxylase
VVGTGFVVAGGADVAAVLDGAARSGLAELGAHVVRFVPPGEEPGSEAELVDEDTLYLPWLKAAGYEAVVIRPDFYVFGGVASAADLPRLLEELFGKLALA